MAGIDNGTLQGGVFFQALQFGPILRGMGPPIPQAGVMGSLYIDVLSWNLYNKRSPDSGGDVDPWGRYLFQVPAPYRTALKYFSSTAPDNTLGQTGDYCLLWAGSGVYGMQPAVYGPKQPTGWPENGDGPGVAISATVTVLPAGLTGEGAPLVDSSSTQLIQTGLLDEALVPIAVIANAGDLVSQIGLQSGPVSIAVGVNPLYTAEDQHVI